MENILFFDKSKWVRRQALEMAVRAGKGHLGGAYSCVEILTAIFYGGVFSVGPVDAQSKTRDRFIFSKGHACLALYPILADLGFFKSEKLETYGKDGSMLGGHPDHFIPGVELSTGSLGHGLSVACGLALAARLDNKDSMTIALLGDGECNEGSIWEAAIFAAAQRLSRLVAIIDNNKISATDFTSKLLGSGHMAERWKSFGWTTSVVDGHDFGQLLGASSDAKNNASGRPYAIIAETIKGKGVSFMENNPAWHHGIPQGEMLAQARRELE